MIIGIINLVLFIKFLFRVFFSKFTFTAFRLYLITKFYRVNKGYNLKKVKQLKTKLGNELVVLLPDLGPAFVKLGQFLASRADLLDEVICSELSKLHDSIPQAPFSVIKSIIEQDLKLPIENLFAEINEQAIAAASVAQVHKAVTFDGINIALKVLRPNIEKKFSANLALLHFVASLVSKILPPAKRLRLEEIVKAIKKTSVIELNMQYEAAAASQLGDNSQSDSNLYIPKVFWQYSGLKVLALEWIDGISISKKEILLEQGFDLAQIAYNLANIFFNQAYKDGFFHADIHPGNVLINKKGQIVLIDFGMVSFLPERDRLYIAEILYAFTKRDYYRVAELHFKAGYVPKTQSLRLFALACRSIAEPVIGKPINEIPIAKLLKRLFAITSEFGMETQPQLLLLQKNMVTVEGTIYSLYPEANLWQYIQPWFKKWGSGHLTKLNKIRQIKRELTTLIDIGIDKLSEIIPK